MRRRERAQAELLDALRLELAATRRQLDALTETLPRLRDDLVGEARARDGEIGRALGAIVEACESVAEEVRSDRRGRIELRDAIANLTVLAAGMLPAAGRVDGRATVLGGSVDPSGALSPVEPVLHQQVGLAPVDLAPVDLGTLDAAPADQGGAAASPVHRETEEEIVLEAGLPAPASLPDGVEVRCRFGDHWVTGFDVCDVVERDGEMRYRLRRRSDGCVLPALFDAVDVRFFTAAPATR